MNKAITLEERKYLKDNFPSLEIFGHTYNYELVSSRIIAALKNMSSKKEKIDFLYGAWIYLDDMGEQREVELSLVHEDMNEMDRMKIESANAFHPINNFIEKKITELRKANTSINTKSFIMQDVYMRKLSEVYEYMSDIKVALICSKTKYSDFLKLFLNLSSSEITKPVVWTAYQRTLLNLFTYLFNNGIIVDPKRKLYKTLDLCFDKEIEGQKFKNWKDVNKRAQQSCSLDQNKIDHVISIFMGKGGPRGTSLN